jgi:hypothetical protein
MHALDVRGGRPERGVRGHGADCADDGRHDRDRDAWWWRRWCGCCCCLSRTAAARPPARSNEVLSPGAAGARTDVMEAVQPPLSALPTGRRTASGEIFFDGGSVAGALPHIDAHLA